jgi:hypothetical protein
MAARETTQNVRASEAEKAEWAECAVADGFVWHKDGEPRGNVSRWLRELGNREVGRRKRRKK